MAVTDRIMANPVIATGMAVQKRTKADAADQFGAAIAFFGFLSLFPLIALVVAVGGFVLAGDDAAVADLVNGIQEAIPGLGGDTIGGAIDSVINNAGTIGVVGFLGVLFSGLRVTNAAQTATQFVFGVDLSEVSALKQRLWQVASLLILGVLAFVTVGASSYARVLVDEALPGALGSVAPVAAYVAGALLDIVLFWVAYRIYAMGSGVSWRGLLPGAVFGGILWALLKYFGGTYLSSQASSSVVSGDEGNTALLMLGTVIGLLALFYLAGRIYVYGAELSAVMAGIGSSADRRAEERAVTEAARADADAPAGTDDDVETADTDGTAGDTAGVATGTAATAPGDEATAGSLADRFRQRGAVVDDSVTVPTADGTGTEVVPWQAPAATALDDRRNRQAAAFATAALAVVVAGFLGRNK